MRIAAGLACLALLAGCGGSQGPAAVSAVRYSPDIAEDFAALPRVNLDTAQARAINAALDRIDVAHREDRASCLEMKPDNDNVEWGRLIEVSMEGPRFVSIVMTQGDYCGGAHPNSGSTPLVFDLETGEQIQWDRWLPADMSAPILEVRPDSWGQAPALQSPTLKAWFAERALAGMDTWGRKECADLYSAEWRNEWSLAAWPDAKAGGLRLRTAGLAHAAKGCETDVVMPLRELKRRGVSKDFTDALEAARRGRLWRDTPPERNSAG